MIRAIAQAFFLIAGLLASGYTAFRIAERYFYQGRETQAFDRAMALRKTAFTAAAPATTGSPIGMIEIPRLSIRAVVREGVDERTLDVAVGHIQETALPGRPGNVGVAAHRDGLFRNLKDVRLDDRITFATLDGEFSYRVVSYSVVEPTDVSVLDPSPAGKTLTLVTCYPFYFAGSAPKRFVVSALQEVR